MAQQTNLMCLTSIVQLFVSVTFILAERTKEEIEKALKESKLIPDLLNSTPDHPLEVKYENVSIDFGNNVTIYQLHKEPVVSWPVEKGALYTLVLSSPDYPAPNAPGQKEWVYWCVSNIRAHDVKQGYALTPYEGPGYSYGPVPRRFLFSVWKQPIKEKQMFFPDEDRLREGLERSEFSLKNFTGKHNFTKPVAVNFFRLPTLKPKMWDPKDPWVPVRITKRPRTAYGQRRGGGGRGGFRPRFGDQDRERRPWTSGNFTRRPWVGGNWTRRPWSRDGFTRRPWSRDGFTRRPWTRNQWTRGPHGWTRRSWSKDEWTRGPPPGSWTRNTWPWTQRPNSKAEDEAPF